MDRCCPKRRMELHARLAKAAQDRPKARPVEKTPEAPAAPPSLTVVLHRKQRKEKP